ncbi:MAG: GNAT family N-acetyltransferase [Sulfitobacter sp.]
MKTLVKGKYTAQQATGPEDIEDARALRARCFGGDQMDDANGYDGRSIHILIKDVRSNMVVCCYRLFCLLGADLDRSYAAQFYDLLALRNYPGLMIELSRFCVHPEWHDPDIVRVAWAAMTDLVDAHDVKMLFGCASFVGVEATAHLDAFALLKARHLAPECWSPGVKAPDVYKFADRVQRKPDTRKAMGVMPPLLRSYLLMGGWVSDHAVIDAQMNTLHVFTGLEVEMIPAGRKRLLRALV